MEDIFESLLALMVIVIPLLLKRQNKNKEKPGQKRPAAAPKKPAHAAPKHDPDALRRTLAEVEKKLDAWMEDLDDEPETAEEMPAARSDMQPQYLQPEPLVPEMLQAERLQETGLSEGSSRTDDFGCVGGSMGHAADGHHQGEDFHAAGTHAARRDDRDEPMMVERVKPAVSAADLRKAVIWKEILDCPVSMREQA